MASSIPTGLSGASSALPSGLSSETLSGASSAEQCSLVDRPDSISPLSLAGIGSPTPPTPNHSRESLALNSFLEEYVKPEARPRLLSRRSAVPSKEIPKLYPFTTSDTESLKKIIHRYSTSHPSETRGAAFFAKGTTLDETTFSRDFFVHSDGEHFFFVVYTLEKGFSIELGSGSSKTAFKAIKIPFPLMDMTESLPSPEECVILKKPHTELDKTPIELENSILRSISSPYLLVPFAYYGDETASFALQTFEPFPQYEKMTSAEIATTIFKAAKALMALHSNGLAHNDVHKNVARRGLIDFGETKPFGLRPIAHLSTERQSPELKAALFFGTLSILRSKSPEHFSIPRVEESLNALNDLAESDLFLKKVEDSLSLPEIESGETSPQDLIDQIQVDSGPENDLYQLGLEIKEALELYRGEEDDTYHFLSSVRDNLLMLSVGDARLNLEELLQIFSMTATGEDIETSRLGASASSKA